MNRFTAVTISCAVAAAGAILVRPARGQDSDRDSVPDSIESQVLSALAPVWYSPEPSHTGPQSIEWMCRHGFVRYYLPGNSSQQRYPTGEPALTPDQFLSELTSLRASGAYDFQWGYYNADDDRYNNVSWDPMGWAYCQSNDKGVYGRVHVSPDDPHLLSVQYYMHFGWNETDTPPGCDAGNHEGDWVGVDFDVDATNLLRPRIVRAFYHNHGRQIFIESPEALNFSGSHPHVYLERGTQEAWPFAAEHGMSYWDQIPACISTNKRLMWDDCPMEMESGCNGGYTAVREHEGTGGGFFIAPLNVGERCAPADNAEARFFFRFDGKYGSEFHSGCYWVDYLNASCPSGPPHAENGEKMWYRMFDRTRNWSPVYINQVVVHVSTTPGTRRSGFEGEPVSRLSSALPLAQPGGTIRMQSGSYTDVPMTIRQSVRIEAVGGPVTIAP